MIEESTVTMSASASKTEVHAHTKMMTMADIANKLHEELPDEISGANGYLDMAISAQEMEHFETARNLAAIARDEYTHAAFIYHYMMKSGIDVSEKCKKDYDEMELRFQREFR
jgi:ferritin